MEYQLFEYHPLKRKSLGGMNRTLRESRDQLRRVCLVVGIVLALTGVTSSLAQSADTKKDPGHPAVKAVQDYARALAIGNSVGVAQLDFVCLLKMMQDNSSVEGVFAPLSDPVYSWCWKRLVQVHARAIDAHDRGLDELWPGKGELINFADFKRFLIAETGARQPVPSLFVMEHIGSTAGTVGFTLEPLGTGPLPHASFRMHDQGPVVAVPTTLVRLKIQYPDPITAPVANAPGQKDWAVPYKKPLRPVKAVTVKWVVLSELGKLGFPTDTAVLSIPLETSMGTTIPFVIEAGGYLPNSTEWWEAGDAPQALDSAVIRAKTFDDRRKRIEMLNRVLAIQSQHQQALETISQELYAGLLDYGAKLHGVSVPDPILSQRFDQLYWTVQSQTDRMDISLGMEMGGKSEPTPADYLYRMIPAMEALVDLQPGDFQNRLRLSQAYRWTNDQLTAILAPQQLLAEVPSDQTDLRARILLELAWSRISKVSWNRHLDDPDIVRGYEEADEAFQLTTDPLDKFTAAYAKAYSLVFRPDRDKEEMLNLLKEARRWYENLPGANAQSWSYLLHNDTLKGLVENDPSFQSLLAANSHM